MYLSISSTCSSCLLSISNLLFWNFLSWFIINFSLTVFIQCRRKENYIFLSWNLDQKLLIIFLFFEYLVSLTDLLVLFTQLIYYSPSCPKMTSGNFNSVLNKEMQTIKIFKYRLVVLSD